ncbi:unnamed protein product [Gulo gulo]|uniref:Uncharacterized protein n=1 Tax=Gulo gulo TaxID=48420 RepID=A0A9X9M954_GULGU|nr:unnamed protein product [Gulo gulo]
MMRSRTWWPFSIAGRSSTEPAGSSGQAANCWSGTETSTARSWASSGEASGRASSQQGKQNQSQRYIPALLALWPSPVRNSSANIWNAITLLRSSHEYLQEIISSRRIPAQANKITSSSNILIHRAGRTKLKVKRSKKVSNLCLKV